jgi:hypothetical protein
MGNVRVLISKYEARALTGRYPNLEECPDFVEVAALVPSVAELTDEEQKRLSDGIMAANR